MTLLVSHGSPSTDVYSSIWSRRILNPELSPTLEDASNKALPSSLKVFSSGLWHVFVESVGLESSLFTRDVGVDDGTEVLDFEPDLVLGSGGSSLERQVLELGFRAVSPMPSSSFPIFPRV